MKRFRPRWRRWAAWFVAALLAWLAGSFVVAYLLTRRPHALRSEPPPAVAWPNPEAIRLTTSDGEELGAWLLDGRADKPILLLLHGNGGCRSDLLGRAEKLAAEGYSALLVSMRAHGDSSGTYNDFGYGAQHDVVAAVEWIERRYPGRKLIVWGQSLGSAAALFAAERLSDRVSGYILECPYSDLRTAVWNRLRLYLMPGLDGVAYAGVVTVAPLVVPHLDRISPLEASRGVPSSVPVLILTGSRDRRACPREAEAIAEQLAGPVKLVVVEGGDHLKLDAGDPDSFWQAIKGFLSRCSP